MPSRDQVAPSPKASSTSTSTPTSSKPKMNVSVDKRVPRITQTALLSESSDIQHSRDSQGHSHRLAYLPQHSDSLLVRSKSIPITNRIKRTNSEAKLQESEQVADFRDYIMFSRIVDGIARSQQHTRNCQSRLANEETLLHIIGTRNLTQDQLKPEGHVSTENETATTPSPLKRTKKHQSKSVIESMQAVEPMSLRMFVEHSLPNGGQPDDEIFPMDL